MLYSVDSQKYIRQVPHEADFRRWRAKISDAEFAAIQAELRARIDGGEIHTSSWIPGNDWTDTVYDPIYSKACDGDTVASGKCFGLFLWVTLMENEDVWAFGRYEKNGVPIEGLTYFKLGVRPHE